MHLMPYRKVDITIDSIEGIPKTNSSYSQRTREQNVIIVSHRVSTLEFSDKKHGFKLIKGCIGMEKNIPCVIRYPLFIMPAWMYASVDVVIML